MNLVKLKKEKIEVDYNVKKIENIIENNENLEEYILIIESNKQDTPNKLTSKILNRINDVKVTDVKVNEKIKDETKNAKENKKIENIELSNNYEIINLKAKNSSKLQNEDKVIKRLERKFIDIIKIAACTVFALLIWEITPRNVTYAQNNINVEKIDKVEESKTETIKGKKINRKVSDFFMSPINIERGDK